jgi:hypothetical protein
MLLGAPETLSAPLTCIGQEVREGGIRCTAARSANVSRPNKATDRCDGGNIRFWSHRLNRRRFFARGPLN